MTAEIQAFSSTLSPDEIRSLYKRAEERKKLGIGSRTNRDRPIRKFHGLSRNQYETLVRETEGKCFLCGIQEKLILDHNHKTGKARKFLCRSCNFKLGYAEALFKEAGSIEAVVEYLKFGK